MTDIAIAHKDYDVRGGGEVVAEYLARAFDAPLIVGRRDEACEPDDLDVDLRELPIGRIRETMVGVGSVVRSVAYLTLWQQDASELAEYDVVITSGNEPLWYTPPDEQTLVAYTHATPRLLTDRWHEQDFSSPIGRVAALVKGGQRAYYRSYRDSPDLFVCNSDLVARRVERYYNVPSAQITVVYPPVPTHEYSPDAKRTGDYYLGLSRLSAAKSWDEVVATFGSTDREFLLAGDGDQRSRLEKMAAGHDNIKLLGYVSEARKRELLAGAKATVFNACNEDFGMVPIESFAAGTPVIGVREGFTKYQVVDGVNGWTYNRGKLLEALDLFESQGVVWEPSRIQEFAERFSVDAFEAGMKAAVERARNESGIEVPWSDDVQPRTDQPAAAADGGVDP